jgi:proton-translocating NADH-quinone oxidoreductase chain N
MDNNLALTLTILIPTVGAAIIYLVGRLHARRWGDSSEGNPAGWVSFFILLLTGAALALAARPSAGGPAIWKVGAITSALDGIGLLLAAVAIGLGVVVVLFSTRYMRGEVGEEKFYALLTAMVGTIIGLGCSQDLFNLWLWFESMAVTSYMLVAFYREQPASLEAGVKYLVQSATGSVLVLMGIALVFSQSGTLDLAAIAAGSAQAKPAFYLAAGALFIIGFGVKVAMVPLHTWLPDAHSQAPSGISAMLSGVVIEAGLIALLRSVGALAGVGERWGWILLGFGALNMLVGNLMALRQVQVKRLLAYSSVSHIGYMLLGLGIALVFENTAAAAGSFFHLINHALMKGLAFLAAGALLYGLYLSRGVHQALELDDLNGAARKYPLAAFAFSLAVLGLGGLPPLAGFMSKWQIFVGGFETGNAWAMGLVIFAALNSVLSLAYYAPLVNRLYRTQPGPALAKARPLGGVIQAALLVLAAAVVLLGFVPNLANWLTQPAGQALLLTFGF